MAEPSESGRITPFLTSNLRQVAKSLMHEYITDTEFAVKNLLQIANKEEKILQELSSRLPGVEAQFLVNKWDFDTSDLNDDFSDAYVMAAFRRMAKAHKEAEALKFEMATLQASIGTHQQATQAIAAAILQIAKQGISVVHGGLAAAPHGRIIGTLPIRDIIWQARNQALHFEEGSFGKAVTTLFSALEAEHGTQFSLAQHAKLSRAKQVLVLLGWDRYENYLADMVTLLP